MAPLKPPTLNLHDPLIVSIDHLLICQMIFQSLNKFLDLKDLGR